MSAPTPTVRHDDTSARFLRPSVRTMSPYVEESEDGLNLMANTNIFEPNPVIAHGLGDISPVRLQQYPSLTSQRLRNALARLHGLSPEQIVTGNGSNDLIDVVLRSVLGPGDTVAFHPPTFSMIETFIRLNHGTPVTVPLSSHDWSLDIDAMLAAQAKVTMVVRPNNPTGNAFPRADIERLVHESRGLVVVDEAYGEFFDEPSFMTELAAGASNLVVLRTFSKAYGLAGLRVGYAAAPPQLAAGLEVVRAPFRLNAVAEEAAVAAVADPNYVANIRAAVQAERPRMAAMLSAHGFVVSPSQGNFLLARCPDDVAPPALVAALAARGVHVRHFGGPLARHIRVTIGPNAATASLAHALDEALREVRA